MSTKISKRHPSPYPIPCLLEIAAALRHSKLEMEANQSAPQNRCGLCGASSYRQVVERDAHGVMRHGDRIVCSGCANEFDDMEAWRRGRSDKNLEAPQAQISVTELRDIVRTYRYRDAMHVVVDSLPQPYQDQFAVFLRGSAQPVGDGLNRYAFVQDFERWLKTLG